MIYSNATSFFVQTFLSRNEQIILDAVHEKLENQELNFDRDQETLSLIRQKLKSQRMGLLFA